MNDKRHESRNGRQALIDVLDQIEDYLEKRQDTRDGEDGPRPNEAMSLLSDLANARTEWARYEWLRSETGWIEGRPDKPGTYIALTGGCQVVLAEYEGGMKGWNYGYVSHYMVIPETPFVMDTRTGKRVPRQEAK